MAGGMKSLQPKRAKFGTAEKEPQEGRNRLTLPSFLDDLEEDPHKEMQFQPSKRIKYSPKDGWTK